MMESFNLIQFACIHLWKRIFGEIVKEIENARVTDGRTNPTTISHIDISVQKDVCFPYDTVVWHKWQTSMRSIQIPDGNMAKRQLLHFYSNKNVDVRPKNSFFADCSWTLVPIFNHNRAWAWSTSEDFTKSSNHCLYHYSPSGVQQIEQHYGRQSSQLQGCRSHYHPLSKGISY